MANKTRSEMYDYFLYAYVLWDMGEEFVRDGVKYGYITEEECEEILKSTIDDIDW